MKINSRNVRKVFFIIALSLCTWSASAQVAQLLINEVNPNIAGSYDLIELVALSGGRVGGFTIAQGITTAVVLDTMPQVTVAAGDFIIVHLNPTSANGNAVYSETVNKFQYSTSIYTANYDAAWDFNAGVTGMTFGNRVLVVKDSSGNIQDAVAFTNNSGTPVAFPNDVQLIQSQNLWLPVDCGGSPCTYISSPTAESISVTLTGVGTSRTGISIQRNSDVDKNDKTDWSLASSTWGMLNPGQSIALAVNETVQYSKHLLVHTIFPNPATNLLTVTTNTHEQSEIILYDVASQKLMQEKFIGSVSLNIETLAKGIYLYEVRDENGMVENGKVVKE